MSNPVEKDPIASLRDEVAGAASRIGADDASISHVRLERSAKPEFGDYSTNAAMVIAPTIGGPPRDVATSLAHEVGPGAGGQIERVEVAGPGFINLHLADSWFREAVSSILDAGTSYGMPQPETPERILVEFVSANPTGPLTAAGGRHAAFGDSLARILEFCGNDVVREYLVNDAGGQIEQFALSIAARMRDSQPPEDGYPGEYVKELAGDLKRDGVGPDDLRTLGERGVEAMRSAVEQTLARYRVEFDVWFSERTVHEDGRVDATVAKLRDEDLAYESEGAVWLRTSRFGDDKDRVLVRASGEPTYFAADIAYHDNKLHRADRLINVLGPDHHGYVPRMRAAITALGADPDRFEVLLLQLVNLIDGGERAQMSKRRGEFVTLDELIDDIGVDATRFFMLQRSHETTLDLDLELARRTSQDNPVFYVQYAHARIAGILRKADAESSTRCVTPERSPPIEPSERLLIARLLEFPATVSEAAERRAPHRLCAYAREVAAAFHAFYRDCQVVGAGPGTEEARLEVCAATRTVIAATLALVGVDAPDRM